MCLAERIIITHVGKNLSFSGDFEAFASVFDGWLAISANFQQIVTKYLVLVLSFASFDVSTH